MPSQSIIWAAAALQNCWTASPEISPRAAAPRRGRYVGETAAKFMTEHNLCLEEFAALYQ